MNSIVYSYTNFDYVEIAELWSKYIQRLKLNYVIFCVDNESYEYLLNKRIKCELIKNLINSEYDFTDLGLIRFKLMIKLFENYKYVTYSDVDAFWFKNPLSELNKNSYDLNLSTVIKRGYPKNIRKKLGATLCTGWMNLKSSCKHFIQDFIDNYYNFEGNDQGKFNNYLYNLIETIKTEIYDHYFELNLEKYNLKALGLSQNIVRRGSDNANYYIDHPVIGIHGGVRRKIKKLKKMSQVGG